MQNREDEWTQTKEDKEEQIFQHNRSYIALSVWMYCRSSHVLLEEEEKVGNGGGESGGSKKTEFIIVAYTTNTSVLSTRYSVILKIL